jgi:HD-GYP domain-containing protein (c-di-GMP phosphodiesterase class II)
VRRDPGPSRRHPSSDPDPAGTPQVDHDQPPGRPGTERVPAAEVIGSLCLATDLGTGLPFEHGLQSTLFAARLSARLGLDRETSRHAYFACLLFHSGCTTDAELAAEIFAGSMSKSSLPVMFASRPAMVVGLLRSLPSPGSAPARGALEIARRAPRAARTARPHFTAACEVAQMLARRLGLPAELSSLLAYMTERWDGRGPLRRAAHDEIPLPVRVVHVAQDAAVHRMLSGVPGAARAVLEHAGAGLDPEIAAGLAAEAEEILALDPEASAWDEALAREPAPRLRLAGEAIDTALAAMGDFADLASPYLAGHSAGVAALASAAARRCALAEEDVVAVRRAGNVHDLGRVAIPAATWHRPGPLTPDEWERVRLHAYHSERVLVRSPSLGALARLAGAHHERLDGSGYHRGTRAPELSPAARLLAAADSFRAMTEPRPHRPALPPAQAAERLGEQCRAGRFDTDTVAAVLEAGGQEPPPLERPSGLTEREAEVVALLARGLLTKQIAVTLGISPKTADHHIQNAYGKIGVSTRAAAALFAMEHGLVAWGELPMARVADRA